MFVYHLCPKRLTVLFRVNTMDRRTVSQKSLKDCHAHQEGGEQGYTMGQGARAGPEWVVPGFNKT